MRPTLRSGPRSATVALATATLVVAAALVVLVQPKAANAAELTEVTDFGSNPSNLRMYLYVPDNVAPEPAVLVAAHYCTGTGPEFYNNTEFASLADQHGFIVIYPSVTRSSECFDVSSPEALTRGGGSDPVGINSMVDHVLANHGADPDRVFITGHSSGGMMTNVMLGLYPDVFAAGAAFAGVPFGCFATDDGSGWNSQCANGQIDHTPQEWGDMVRNAYSEYNGPRPRMQLWHGTEDGTLDYHNFGEAIEQWTNVLGTDQTPEVTDNPESSWTRTRYGGTGSRAPVEAISIQGAGHNFMSSGMAARVIEFFGLEDSTNNGDLTRPPADPPERR